MKDNTKYVGLDVSKKKLQLLLLMRVEKSRAIGERPQTRGSAQGRRIWRAPRTPFRSLHGMSRH